MLKVSYHNKEGKARSIAVPTIDGVDPQKVAQSVLKDALADSGPISVIRLVSDTEIVAEAATPAPTAPSGQAPAKS